MDKFIITFTAEQLNVLNEALCNMPFKVAAPLVAYINVEIQRALEAAKITDSTT